MQHSRQTHSFRILSMTPICMHAYCIPILIVYASDGISLVSCCFLFLFLHIWFLLFVYAISLLCNNYTEINHHWYYRIATIKWFEQNIESQGNKKATSFIVALSFILVRLSWLFVLLFAAAGRLCAVVESIAWLKRRMPAIRARMENWIA